MTLLQEAKKIAVRQKKGRVEVGKEDVELVVAYLKGEVYGAQLKKVKGLAELGGQYYGYLIRTLTYGLKEGMIEIILKEKK